MATAFECDPNCRNRVLLVTEDGLTPAYCQAVQKVLARNLNIEIYCGIAAEGLINDFFCEDNADRLSEEILGEVFASENMGNPLLIEGEVNA
ncbi:MAG TPA: hypothetical protein VGF75_00175 [Candidatus Saccharimonadales bacterium]|jgi:hypothetical protein